MARKRNILIGVIAVLIVLFLPLAILGVITILVGLFWRPLRKEHRTLLVIVGGLLLLVSYFWNLQPW